MERVPGGAGWGTAKERSKGRRGRGFTGVSQHVRPWGKWQHVCRPMGRARRGGKTAAQSLRCEGWGPVHRWGAALSGSGDSSRKEVRERSRDSSGWAEAAAGLASLRLPVSSEQTALAGRESWGGQWCAYLPRRWLFECHLHRGATSYCQPDPSLFCYRTFIHFMRI